MTSQNDVFDIKTATALVQPYDGSTEGLDAFIDATNLLSELIKPAHQAVAAKFLKTRLTGKARLGLPESANTITDIAQNVKSRCAGKTTPENIAAKLKATKLKGSVDSFCEEIDTLTTKLKAVYLQNQVPELLANSMATKAGVDALINGTTSQETKIILKAGAFTDIKDAIQKVMENSNANLTNSQVLSYNARNQNSYRNQQRYRNPRGNTRYYQNGPRDQQQGNRYRNTQNNGYQQQNQQQRYYNNNHNHGQRGRPAQRRIYTTNAQQAQQPPMSMPMPMAMQMPVSMQGNQYQGMPSPRHPPTMMQIPFLDPGQVMSPPN